MNIPAPHGQLEAAHRQLPGTLRGAGVVCHPHPLQGGTMHTKAVFRAAQALADVKIAALRFNFRGVEGSQGEFTNGEIEQDDVKAALDLDRQWPERRPGPCLCAFPGRQPVR